jgi:hypothetical protein
MPTVAYGELALQLTFSAARRRCHRFGWEQCAPLSGANAVAPGAEKINKRSGEQLH